MNKAVSTIANRLGTIIQIRHDWVHNCGRPKSSVVTYTHGEAEVRIKHVQVFVEELDDHLEEHRLA